MMEGYAQAETFKYRTFRPEPFLSGSDRSIQNGRISC